LNSPDLLIFFFFFFSSRRRHTRWPRDWSSDVCSSDLILLRRAAMLLSNSKESPVFRRGESQLQTPGVITYRTLIGQTFWSYDDPVTVWLKTAYVRLREPGGLGGAFVWAL